MKLPYKNQIVNKHNNRHKSLDSPSVWCGNFSELSLGLCFFIQTGRSYHADPTNINGTG